LQYKLQKF